MNDVRWLSDDEQRAWRAYLRMQGSLGAELNRRLQASSGLSLADYEVLVHLTDTPEGRLRPYELQRALHWEQSRLSHHLRRMEKRGLVRREECDEDKRGAYVLLTEEGRRAITEAAPDHVASVRGLFIDALSPEQVGLLERLADRVLARIEGGGA